MTRNNKERNINIYIYTSIYDNSEELLRNKNTCKNIINIKMQLHISSLMINNHCTIHQKNQKSKFASTVKTKKKGF